VSVTLDGWSADTTKMGFLGMTAHWIEVKGNEWKMRSEVIGFKALSGAHTGENLGRYAVGLLDRVGIMDEKSSKARHVLTSCHDYISLLFFFSYIRQPLTTQATTIQLAKLSKISTIAVVFRNGAGANINYRMHIVFLHIFTL
jgi:hypothetical protein